MTYHTAKQGGTRFKRIGEVIAELKKVVWLSRREAAYLTGIVLVATLISGAFLGARDRGL